MLRFTTKRRSFSDCAKSFELSTLKSKYSYTYITHNSQVKFNRRRNNENHEILVFFNFNFLRK